MKKQYYLVTGTIEIQVLASDAKHAVQRATQRAVNLNKSPSLDVRLERIAREVGPNVFTMDELLKHAALVDL